MVRTSGRYAFAAGLAVAFQAFTAPTGPRRISPLDSAGQGVGAQYDSAHVYVAPADMAPFVASFTATLEESPPSQPRRP